MKRGSSLLLNIQYPIVGRDDRECRPNVSVHSCRCASRVGTYVLYAYEQNYYYYDYYCMKYSKAIVLWKTSWNHIVEKIWWRLAKQVEQNKIELAEKNRPGHDSHCGEFANGCCCRNKNMIYRHLRDVTRILKQIPHSNVTVSTSNTVDLKLLCK